MPELQPGSDLAGYRIEAVERSDTDGAVLLARDPDRDRGVVLHVASASPRELSAIRFLERARGLQGLEHPHLLRVYGTHTFEGRCVAVGEAPPGRRLDRLRPSAREAVAIVRQVASAVDALEAAGVEPPPLTADRIWVDARGAHLDGLDARSDIPLVHRAASSSAALAELLESLVPRRPAPLCQVITRARDGAYLTAGQFAGELGAVERRLRRRRFFAR